MLVYSSEFPILISKNVEDIFNVFLKWVNGSQHYPFYEENDIILPDNDIYFIEKNGYHLELAHITMDHEEYCGMKFQFTEDEKLEWTTEVTAYKNNSSHWITAKIFCDLLEPSAELPVPKKPYIIKLLFSELGGGDDGVFTASDRPIYLKDNDEDIELASSIVNGTIKCSLPIIYISLGFDGHSEFKCRQLAHHTSGMAHVLIEPSRKFSVKLSALTASQNCYGGAACIYWPNGTERQVKILPRRYPSIKIAQNDIVDRIKNSVKYSKTRNGVNWSKIKELLSNYKLSELKKSGDQNLTNYMSSFDELNGSLKDQLEQANARIQTLENNILLFQHALAQKSDISVSMGKEKEFYPGEFKDAILVALKKSLPQIGDDTRLMFLVKDVIVANEISDSPDKIESAVRNALEKSAKFGVKERAALENMGFSVYDDGRHIKVVYYGDPRFTFSISRTASDHRSGKNAVSDICKKILIK